MLQEDELDDEKRAMRRLHYDHLLATADLMAALGGPKGLNHRAKQLIGFINDPDGATKPDEPEEGPSPSARLYRDLIQDNWLAELALRVRRQSRQKAQGEPPPAERQPGVKPPTIRSVLKGELGVD